MFKVGQKVVCVDDDIIYEVEQAKYSPDPIKGEIYTVCYVDDRYIALEELDKYSLFESIGFRPLNESFAESVLENIKEQIKEEQLELV